MQHARRLLVLAALVVAVGVGADQARADTPVYCPTPNPEPLPDGSVRFGNEANGAGCVIVRAAAEGSLTLDQIVLAPGWSGRIKSVGGDSSGNRVVVRFTEFASARVVKVRVEPGRTIIKG